MAEKIVRVELSPSSEGFSIKVDPWVRTVKISPQNKVEDHIQWKASGCEIMIEPYKQDPFLTINPASSYVSTVRGDLDNKVPVDRTRKYIIKVQDSKKKEYIVDPDYKVER